MTAVRSDEQLARAAARGDRAAFTALVRRYAAGLAAFCRGLLGDAGRAEDAAQEAFLKVYRALPRFDPERRFAPWLYKIAQNACVDAIRAEREVPAAGGDAVPLSREDDGRLEEAMSELPPKHQAVLHYKYRLGMNAAEIAEQMGLGHADVRVCLHRAIRFLRGRIRG